MITSSPCSTARINSVRRFLASAVLTSIGQLWPFFMARSSRMPRIFPDAAPDLHNPAGTSESLDSMEASRFLPNFSTGLFMATIPNLTGSDQGLPADVQAEKTILGAILLDNAAHAEAAEKLSADDFSLDSHQRIYIRMTELLNEQRAVDIVTLSHELARHKELEAVRGVAYLAELTEGLPRRPVIDEYIKIVKDKALLRRLMAICSAHCAGGG